jgi:hypothetical protein
MKFVKILFWEFVQNLPVLAGLVLAYEQWQKGHSLPCAAFILAGSLGSSVLIALTEKWKVPGHREPVNVFLTNLVGMLVATTGLVAYLSAGWGSWMTDLAIGSVGGAGLGIAQSLAARERIDGRHCLALGIAAALALLLIRGMLSSGWPAWLNITGITLLATLIIAFIDYTPESVSQSHPS